MQRLITYVLILGFVSPCLCLRWNHGAKNNFFDVMEHGAQGDGKSDDSQAFLSAWNRACGTEGAATLVIPPSKLFMVTNITLEGGTCKAKSIHIQLKGGIVAPGMDKWRGDRSYWMMIQYVNNLTIDGGGLINGSGPTWWTKCNRSCERPTALRFHSCNGLSVSNLNMSNSPGAHISINGCDGVRFSNISIHAPGDSPNTDGFDISASKNILIQDSTIGTGDDCIAINGGTSYINVTRVACGPGHGISIGSLGREEALETVEEIYVRNCSFIGTTNGARIKTCPGGSGYARKITFEQIKLIGAQKPILIDQYYGSASVKKKRSSVKVSEVTYRDFEGTSADEKAINLNCSSSGCFKLVLDQIKIESSKPGKKTYAYCQNAHGTVGSAIPNVSCLLS